ncbi:hypothetical protein [Novosphingobium sp. BW1]|uniref:hypothetical protein n=1 Tax=Novosphingobium sp. BW1 TaxID=2592621 RepID=UPI0011DF8452|nr:hypothetical protein [Novosphingobium sp. BW1]
MNAHFAHSDGARWRLGLVLFAAIGLMFQSLLVQTHLHGRGDWSGGLVSGRAAEPASSLEVGSGHNASPPCLLCQERAMAGHYTTPPPVSHVGDGAAILQIPATARLAAIHLQRGLPSRHPRGPPHSNP